MFAVLLRAEDASSACDILSEVGGRVLGKYGDGGVHTGLIFEFYGPCSKLDGVRERAMDDTVHSIPEILSDEVVMYQDLCRYLRSLSR